MGSERQRIQIQRPVLTVEQILAGIEQAHPDRVDRLRILYHSFPVLPHLQLLHPFDIPISGILVLDVKSKGVKLIREILCQLRYCQSILIRLPYLSVIDIPDSTVRIEPGDGLEVIGKSVPDADLIPLISGIRVRLHLLQRQRDVRKIRPECGVLFLFVQIGKLLLCRAEIPDWDIDGVVGCHSISDCNLTVGAVPGPSVPLLTHKARGPENAVDLLLHVSAPESQDGHQCHIRIRLAIVALFPMAFIQHLKLFTRFRTRCVFDHSVVIQIGAGFYTAPLHPVCPAHKGIQRILQRLVIPGNRTRAIHITRHRHETVCGTRQVNLQTMLPVVDVVHSLVIGKIR